MAEGLIELDGVGKRYPASRTTAQRLAGLWRGLAGGADRTAAEVLAGIDLRVDRGDALAILGENGAGKSTLLKIIAGVLRPSAGTVAVRGRLGALLELGAGFHPEFSGRQNVRTAATLAGLGGAEVDARLGEIVAFAGLGAAIDQPIKHYSSGMVVRLGFAVITALEPDILISDEVLAVGDASFQKKCIRWLEDYLGRGGTLLLVSHSIYHVQKLCQRAVWLHQGRIRQRGDVFAVSQAYLAHHEAKLRRGASAGPAAPRVSLAAVRINGSGEDDELVIQPGGRLEVAAELRGARGGDALECTIRGADGALMGRHRHSSAGPGLRLALGPVPLLPGHYRLELQPVDGDGRRCGDPRRRMLRVSGESREFGSLRMDHRWR